LSNLDDEKKVGLRGCDGIKMLERFEKEMEEDLRQNFGEHLKFWVWKKYNGVNGFYGTGVINSAVVIWITERPSLPRDKEKKDKFPDWQDKIFYRLLEEEGLENIHLTDFVKIMNTAGKQPTEGELKVSAEWMEKEIGKLKIDGKKLVVVANSRKVEQWVRRYLPEYHPIYYKFFKYTLRFNKKEIREQLLRKELTELKNQK